MTTQNGSVQLPLHNHEVQVHDIKVKPPISVSPSMDWFVNRLGGAFPRGANILLSGDPGVGKSTLALQVAAAVADSGQKVLYLATEQTGDSVRARLNQDRKSVV